MASKLKFDEQLWLGTEAAYHATVARWDDLIAHEAQVALAASTPQAGPAVMIGQEEPELPRLLKIQGNVGVISIRGGLVNSDSPYLKYFGMTGYPEIRDAMIAAAQHEDVKAIVLDISSGGGSVNGVADTANLISSIDSQLKPVYTFTDSAMASAAYWLGSSGRKISASQTAMVGSIGVIATILDYSKALANDGVGVNVVRAGKFKALINSVEAPTKAALEQLQSQLDTIYGIFIGHVADRRKATVAVADEKMGQGREFIGTQALNAGLVDAVETFDALMSRISAKLLDNPGMTQNNSGKHKDSFMKQAFTEQQIAALAAGAPTADAGGAPATGEPAAEGGAPAEGAPAAGAEEPKGTEAAAGTPAAPAADSDIVAFLRGELRQAQADAQAANIALATANSKLASVETTHAALVKIAAQSLSNMRVALNLPVIDATKLTAESLLADHAATTEQFTKAFKAGGVAATPAAKLDKPAAPQRSGLAAASVATVRPK